MEQMIVDLNTSFIELSIVMFLLGLGFVSYWNFRVFVYKIFGENDDENILKDEVLYHKNQKQ